MSRLEKIKTGFEDLFIIKKEVFLDERGYFIETYNKKDFKEIGIECEFIQDNTSKSIAGVVRGMHGQINENQSKLVRVISGEIIDVVIDIRPNSKTFKQSFSVNLKEGDGLAFFVPHGFLHSFCALKHDTIVTYKVSGGYNKAGEFSTNPQKSGINWNFKGDLIVSKKDLEALSLDDFLESERFKNEISKTFI